MDEPIPSSAAFRIQLPTFEGPLDLLLHLIRKHELNVLDLPIAFVTERYLEYLQMMKELDLDVASEYLLMAATLAHIKSKSLLPAAPSDALEDQDEGYQEDPRAELIRRLLEYQKYKAAGEQLGQRPLAGRDVFPRGMSAPEAQGPAPLAGIDMFKLLDAFQHILKRVHGRVALEVTAERITIHERITQLSDFLRLKRACTFEELFVTARTRYEVVVTFLALLEMTKLRMTRIYQADPASALHVQFALLDADAPTIPPEVGEERDSSLPPMAAEADGGVIFEDVDASDIGDDFDLNEAWDDESQVSGDDDADLDAEADGAESGSADDVVVLEASDQSAEFASIDGDQTPESSEDVAEFAPSDGEETSDSSEDVAQFASSDNSSVPDASAETVASTASDAATISTSNQEFAPTSDEGWLAESADEAVVSEPLDEVSDDVAVFASSDDMPAFAPSDDAALDGIGDDVAPSGVAADDVAFAGSDDVAVFISSEHEVPPVASDDAPHADLRGNSSEFTSDAVELAELASEHALVAVEERDATEPASVEPAAFDEVADAEFQSDPVPRQHESSDEAMSHDVDDADEEHEHDESKP